MKFRWTELYHINSKLLESNQAILLMITQVSKCTGLTDSIFFHTDVCIHYKTKKFFFLGYVKQQLT